MDRTIHSVGLGKRYAIGERARYVALRDVLANAMNAPRRILERNRRSGENRSREQLWALLPTCRRMPDCTDSLKPAALMVSV